jgi:6-phosphogluconolactonase
MTVDIRIFKDTEALSRHAADLFVDHAATSIKERGRFLTALNGGSTPNRLFQLLATDHKNNIDWANVFVFWGDERCVPPNETGSSYGQAWEAFLSKVGIPEANIQRCKGELEPAAASKDYAGILKEFASHPLEFPRFDLVYLGMGEDGHTASLFPGSNVEAATATVAVTANYQNRPANRVSLTQLVFNHARTVAFMVTGEKKAATLAEVLSGRYNPELFPAQRIDPKDGNLIWLVDEDSASALPQGLKRKFCEG